MPKKPPLKYALEQAAVEANFRNDLEAGVGQQLTEAGIEFEYEKLIVPYEVPARTAKYITDLVPTRTTIILEVKGHFGGIAGRGIRERSAEQRKKYLLVKEQRPDLDIRFVFQRASTPIYPRSPTSHGKWATDNGFKWSDKGRVPPAWIEEIRQQQQQPASKRKKT